MKIIFTKGLNIKEKYKLNNGLISLGRSTSNDIVINDIECSREHMIIFVHEEVPYLVNIQSHNPVYVNNVALTGKIMLSSGDRITFGDSEVAVYENFEATPAITRATSMVSTAVSLAVNQLMSAGVTQVETPAATQAAGA